MPRYNVEYKGQWACFSSVVDAFITKFMSESEYKDWRKHEYGENYTSLEKRNLRTMEEAAFSITLNRTREEAMETLLECGLDKAECEKIMYDIDTKYYCPIINDDKEYKCPNCGDIIKYKQETCNNETCCLDFIWRD